jgi:hypothetical protein
MPALRGGGGTAAEIGLEAVFGQFGVVLRFEARVFGCGFEGLADVLADAEASFGVFLENLPIVCLFFHFVALVFEAEFLLFAGLRFEAILLLTCFGS